MPLKHSPRIAFVGNYEHNGGSANALYGYVQAARRLGYDVRASLFGRVDPVVRSAVPVADESWTPDLMVFAFESYQFLTPDALDRIERNVPRARRLVIDQDGMYSEETVVGSDTNHPTPQSRSSWSALFERLSGTILQPVLAPATPGVKSFLYFGFNQVADAAASHRIAKPYDVVYVGNNWYRWRDMVRLCEQLAPVRARLGRIAVFGKWWHGETLAGSEEHTHSDPAFLHAHGVEVHPAVAFHQVEGTMGMGRVNPLFVRPVLHALGLVTPRMFETFAAATVPLLPENLHAAVPLYGHRVSPLCLTSDSSAADVVSTILDRYTDYAQLTREIAAELARQHSYEIRLQQLLHFAP